MPVYEVPEDDITVVQADGFEYNLIITDPDGVVDLTGADLWGGIKVKSGTDTELVEFTAAIVNASAGSVKMTLTGAQTTRDILGPKARYFYVKFQLPGDEPTTAVHGCCNWVATDE